MANPFHKRMHERATGFARTNNIHQPKVGVVADQAIKAIETEDDDSAVHDSEQLKARATQRVEDLVRGWQSSMPRISTFSLHKVIRFKSGCESTANF
jgi:hypothetical protein